MFFKGEKKKTENTEETHADNERSGKLHRQYHKLRDPRANTLKSPYYNKCFNIKMFNVFQGSFKYPALLFKGPLHLTLRPKGQHTLLSVLHYIAIDEETICRLNAAFYL